MGGFTDHGDGQKHFKANGHDAMAKAAAAQGYDSLQFVGYSDHEFDPCRDKVHPTMNYELVSTRAVGRYSCGNPGGDQPYIKTGWNHDKPCTCDPKSKFLNCNGVPVLKQSAVNATVMV